MYKLVIGRSNSKHYQKAKEVAISLGGKLEGENIIIKIKDIFKAYNKLFPLFEFNIFKWANTKAYYNDKEVNPYTAMFQAKIQKEKDMMNVVETINKPKTPAKPFVMPSAETILQLPQVYFKKKGYTIFLKNEVISFHLDLTKDEFLKFTSVFKIGDVVNFFD